MRRVYLAALIILGVEVTNNGRYPEMAEDFAKTFRVLKSLPCDVFLAAHASFYDGLGKAEKLRNGAKENPFIDPQGYRAYVERGEKRYMDQVAKERGARP